MLANFFKPFIFFLLGKGAFAQPALFLVSFPLHPYSNPYGEHGGIANDILRHAFQKVGISVQIAYHEFKISLTQAKSNHAAGIFPLYQDKETQADFLFSDPLLSSELVLYQRQDGLNSAPSEKKGGKKICIPKIFARTTGLKEKLSSFKIQINNRPNCVTLLQQGKVDFVLEEKKGIKNGIFAGEQIKKSDLLRIPLHFCLGISKTLPHGQKLINDFNQGLHSLKESGDYDIILDEFKSLDDWER